MDGSLVDATEKDVRQVLEALLPENNIRTACLTLFAESLIHAHRSSRSAGVWAVTLSSKKDFIRLNVGAIEVCALFGDVVHVVLDYTCLSNNDHSKIEGYGGRHWDVRPAYIR